MNCKNCEYGLKQSCGDFEKIICTYEEGECVKITELEQENAELKAQLESERDLPAIAYMQGAEKQKKKDEEHLTKAKEHIRTLISCLIDWVKEGDKYYCHIADAEQFLKE